MRLFNPDHVRKGRYWLNFFTVPLSNGLLNRAHAQQRRFTGRGGQIRVSWVRAQYWLKPSLLPTDDTHGTEFRDWVEI